MNKTSWLLKGIVWIIVFLCLLQVSPVFLTYWRFDGSRFSQDGSLKFDSDGKEIKEISSADLNGDGKPECITAKDDIARITDCGERVFWQSPQGWLVKQAFIGDLNRDGVPELDLLIWRPFNVWPIDSFLPSGGRISNFHNRNGLSCHLILIGWEREGYNELWAGSALIRPVQQLKATDLDGDGKQELVALEGQYDLEESGGTLTVWRWRGFGFVLLDEVKQNFSMIKILHDSNKVWVVAQ